MLFDNIGGRKFTVTLVTVLLTCLLVWFAKIGDQVYATVILGIVIGYIGGNVAQTIKFGKKEEPNE